MYISCQKGLGIQRGATEKSMNTNPDNVTVWEGQQQEFLSALSIRVPTAGHRHLRAPVCAEGLYVMQPCRKKTSAKYYLFISIYKHSN